MCGCQKHHDENATCTCICPEHENFELAHRLAMQRFDALMSASAQISEMEQKRTSAKNEIQGLLDSLDDHITQDEIYSALKTIQEAL